MLLKPLPLPLTLRNVKIPYPEIFISCHRNPIAWEIGLQNIKVFPIFWENYEDDRLIRAHPGTHFSPSFFNMKLHTICNNFPAYVNSFIDTI